MAAAAKRAATKSDDEEPDEHWQEDYCAWDQRRCLKGRHASKYITKARDATNEVIPPE